MPHQAVIPFLVPRMSAVDLLQTVADEELIVSCREKRGGDINQNADPAVSVVEREGLAAEKDGRHNASAQITSEVGGDGVAGEAPDHDSIRQADGEGDTRCRDEGIRGIETGPDHDPDEAVDEELLEEQISLVGLVGIRVHTQDARHAAIVMHRPFPLQVDRFGGLDLRPVAAHQQETGHEGAKDLGEDVVRNLLPREARPDGEGDRDGRVEVAT